MRRIAGIVLLVVAAAACVPTPGSGGGGGTATRPIIGNINISPNAVAEGAPVTVSWSVTDTVAVAGTTLVLRSTTGTAVITACTNAVHLTSGTALDGQYAATCTVPVAQPTGSYLADLVAIDTSGGTAENKTGTFTVTGTGGDSQAPIVVGSPIIGLQSGGSTPVVKVSGLHVTDATGVSAIVLTLSNHVTHATAGGGSVILTSGTVTDGMYAGSITVLPNTPAGTYDVSAAATDSFGNSATTIVGNLGIGA
jgi:hypothetical protein